MTMQAQEIDEHVMAGWYLADMVLGMPDVTEDEATVMFAALPKTDGGPDEDGPDELREQTVRGCYL